MDSARKYVERGQIDKAIREYLRVVREDPKDVRVWLKVGDLYAKKGAKAEATETYLKVAKFYGEQGFYLKAVAVYKQILKLDPRLVEVNLKLAELYRQLGLLSDAMQHFEMVAGHFHREGKIKEALATVRQLVDLDPENVATRIKLAELYSKEGMLEEAVSEFAQACEYLRAHDRQDDFLKVAERLLWHRPDNISLTRELALLYLQRNDPRRALQKLQACFKADPRDVDTLDLLAQAFQALDQKEKTVSVLKELARVLEENGERVRAVEIHRKILEHKPNDPDSLAYVSPGQPPPTPAVPALGSTSRPRPAHPISIASEVPLPSSSRKTGSVPLLEPDAQSMFNRQPVLPTDSPVPPAFRDPSEPYEAPGSFEEELALDEEPSFEISTAGEMHEEEIVKILTETDVYVKYGLHQKAIEHLRRIFDLDPNNLEARERLKDILLSQGRENEAIVELMNLAELTASYDPGHAEAYLREVLAINAAYQGVYELAERYRLRLTAAPEVPVVDGGAVAPIDDEIDFGDIELAEQDVAGAPPAHPRYSDAFDAVDSLDFDLEESNIADAPRDRGGVTVEVSPEQVEGMMDVLDGDDLDFNFVSTSDDSFGDTPVYDPSSADFDAGMDMLGPDLSGPFVPEPEVIEPPPPIDPEDAAAFEAAPISNADIADYESDFIPSGDPMDEYSDYSEFSATNLSPAPELLLADEPDPGLSPGLDAGAPAMETIDTDYDSLDHAEFDLQQLTASTPAAPDDPTSSEIADDLEEADFFVQQGLFNEARDIVNTLLARYPEHPVLVNKLREIDDHERHGVDTAYDLSDPPTAELSAAVDGGMGQARPTVLLEKPIDDKDADTHYDLGLAYKEMGLYDEAIKAFQKVTELPEREAQCRIMIGLCLREGGKFSEAIHQFKTGLHVPTILEREKLSLYYEIGSAYEALNDPREALYYYEMVSKKDARYRDVSERVHAIESVLGRNGADPRRGTGPSPAADDREPAREALLSEPDRDGHRR